MGSRKPVRRDGRMIPAAVNDILVLLDKGKKKEKKKESEEDTKDLWNYLQSNELISVGDEKRLIRFYLEDKDITRMWEIAACRYSEIAHLMAPNDYVEVLEALLDKTVSAPNDDVAKKNYAEAVGPHADKVVNAMLPQPGKSVTFIVKRGEIKGGGGSFSFPWAPNSNKMTIYNRENAYSVDIGSIDGDNSNVQKISLSVQRNPNPDSLPRAMKSPVRVTDDLKCCVMAFTFGEYISLCLKGGKVANYTSVVVTHYN